MDWFLELAKQTPALVTLVVLVNWFLRHLRDERELLQPLATQITQRDDKLFQEHHELTQSVSTALGRSLHIIERMESRLDRDP